MLYLVFIAESVLDPFLFFMGEQSKTVFSDRRIFYRFEEQSFQIFRLSQGTEGSIYLNWPDFGATDWLVPVKEEENGSLLLHKIDSVEDGKVSFHSSGMSAFRAHNNSEHRPLIIRGSRLIDFGKNEGGIRHLITLFIKEPSHLPCSVAMARKSDYEIRTTQFLPSVFVLIAVPKSKKGFQVNIKTSFNIDDVLIPPPGGFGVIEMKYHDIFWLTYNTQNMNKWPQKTQAFFTDGYVIPFFIGAEKGFLKVELRNPKYDLDIEKGKLSIKI